MLFGTNGFAGSPTVAKPEAKIVALHIWLRSRCSAVAVAVSSSSSSIVVVVVINNNNNSSNSS